MRTYQEIFNELNILTDTELASRYKKLWFDINVREFYNEYGNDCMGEDIVIGIIICSRFCQSSGVPVNVTCLGNSLDYDWTEG